MSLGISSEDMELLNAASGVIEEYATHLPDPATPVSFCNYDCSGSCSGGCYGGCTGDCSGGCSGGCYGDCAGSCTGSCTGLCTGSGKVPLK